MNGDQDTAGLVETLSTYSVDVARIIDRLSSQMYQLQSEIRALTNDVRDLERRPH
jgi:outer membrane murein-binding lipoprotein Lpp